MIQLSEAEIHSPDATMGEIRFKALEVPAETAPGLEGAVKLESPQVVDQHILEKRFPVDKCRVKKVMNVGFSPFPPIILLIFKFR